MPGARTDFPVLLRMLAAERIEFIVVGGVAAVMQGAPITTIDLDLVYSRDRDNLARFERVLRELKACSRMKPEVAPDAERLDTSGHHLLLTRLGPLDLLGSTMGEGYPNLIPHTDAIELDPGAFIHVLDLPTLIRIKEALSRDRDLAVLPILRRVLAERGGQ
jgi:hypothetical protein